MTIDLIKSTAVPTSLYSSPINTKPASPVKSPTVEAVRVAPMNHAGVLKLLDNIYTVAVE